MADRSLHRAILRYELTEDLLSYDEVHSALMLAENDLWELDNNSIQSVAVLIPGQMFIRSVINQYM